MFLDKNSKREKNRIDSNLFIKGCIPRPAPTILNGCVHMEKIKCAALQFYDESSNNPIIVCDMNHANCFMLASEKYGPTFRNRNKERDTQGFMTTTDRFVNRYEAFAIAKAAKQLRFKPNLIKTWLDSYDVNFALE